MLESIDAQFASQLTAQTICRFNCNVVMRKAFWIFPSASRHNVELRCSATPKKDENDLHFIQLRSRSRTVARSFFLT